MSKYFYSVVSFINDFEKACLEYTVASKHNISIQDIDRELFSDFSNVNNWNDVSFNDYMNAVKRAIRKKENDNVQKADL